MRFHSTVSSINTERNNVRKLEKSKFYQIFAKLFDVILKRSRNHSFVASNYKPDFKVRSPGKNFRKNEKQQKLKKKCDIKNVEKEFHCHHKL